MRSTRPHPPGVSGDSRRSRTPKPSSVDAAGAPAIAPPRHGPIECPAGARVARTFRGNATYYSDAFRGRRTANGEVYDPDDFTAAHRSLPFGSIVRVTRIDDRSRSVCVRITDRGPFGNRSRIVDLSKAAARQLNMLRAGVVPVQIETFESGANR